MTSVTELMTSVDAAFAASSTTKPWDDPNPGRLPSDDQYSRVTNPGKWRILGERVDAWFDAIEHHAIGTVRRGVEGVWVAQPGTVMSRTDQVMPAVSGGLPLLIGRSRFDNVADAGVTFGVGDPAVCVGFFPDCGCDACDSGSQDALDELDRHMVAVVGGSFRRLSRGDREIVVDHEGRRASGRFGGLGRRGIDTILADPSGWDELTGRSWLS